MIGSRLASVLIFAILTFSVTAISITALVIGYLEKRNRMSFRGKSEELQYRYRSGSPRSSSNAGPQR